MIIKSKLNSNRSGFTMIEILVVVVIIGILATIGTLSFMPSLEKSRDGRRKADLANLSKALEAYHTDHGSYPTSLNGTIGICGQTGNSACNWGEAFVDNKGTVYMASLPSDPGKFEYSYLADTEGNWYALLARFENENDPVRATTSDGRRGVYTLNTPELTNTACGGSGCSYVQYGPTERPGLVVVPEESDETGGVVIEEGGGGNEPLPDSEK